ncbi:TetR family transcriptional regulator [Paractinoplanes abujensis]|uniref:AcrR family transcriptional regulator n=1 Tax=Paractinoplanes abujensis TaxID=882441 RepID=A0A7W7G361_9ACTN|nr:TetR family transcriptional regulator C-terminal domain-containing protein [Actinoplanes abujensis]MBB4693850.1 AcrR family transcriptional regulator [Actinoplanes abujensis]GID21492.1 TetR family transcriptional regulator [Actinoplanes abujensis]
MARTADHDARRQQVAEAVERLVASEGYDAVTVAKTAAAAGISVGLVQHYFPSKDDMLLHAFTHVRERTERRVLADAERADQAGARIEQILLGALTELLPLDDRRRRECRVELAFTGRAVDNPRVAEALGRGNAHLRATLARAIRNGKECGEVPASTDEQAEAARTLAVLDGLKLHAYTEPATMTADAARAALAGELARVFTGECHHRD